MSKTKNNIKLKATKLVHILMDNGGVGSGNWGHSGRPGLRVVSNNRIAELYNIILVWESKEPTRKEQICQLIRTRPC